MLKSHSGFPQTNFRYFSPSRRLSVLRVTRKSLPRSSIWWPHHGHWTTGMLFSGCFPPLSSLWISNASFHEFGDAAPPTQNPIENLLDPRRSGSSLLITSSAQISDAALENCWEDSNLNV